MKRVFLITLSSGTPPAYLTRGSPCKANRGGKLTPPPGHELGDTNYQLALTKWGLKTAIRICALLGCEDPKQAEFASALTVRARPGRLSALSVSRSKSVLHGAFVWARRALDGRKDGGLRPRAEARG